MGWTSSLVEELAQIVGPAHVSAAPAQLESLARTTMPQAGTRPLAVIRPDTREQVQQIARLAVAHKLLIYPISTGKNWGYGDACAPVPGCLIVDLSRMNRILEVNTEEAYAVIEPGVTQGQLATHLEENRIALIMDCNGAGPDAGWIGNTLDRGFGHSRYGDRFSHSCNYEVVLADGSVITTGLGSYPGAQASHVYKWGVGPSLDGLFTQSNLGIVTRMTIWLMPKPESMEFFYVTLKTADDIGDLVDALRRLRLQGTVKSTVHCMNVGRLVASRARFPWHEADGTRALEQQHPELLARLSHHYGLPPWAALGVSMGSRRETAAARRTIRHELRSVRGLDRLAFLDERRFAWARRLAGLLKPFTPNHLLVRSLPEIRMSMNMMAGVPAYETLRGGHWRARTPPPPTMDVLDSVAGLIWLSPVLPMTANAIQKLTKLVVPIFHQFGFEYQVTLSCSNDRALSAIMSICFDKTNSEESSRAGVCSQILTDALMSEGFIPYRGSPPIMERVRKFNPEYWKALSKLKQAWDPDGLIAPGRYLPES